MSEEPINEHERSLITKPSKFPLIVTALIVLGLVALAKLPKWTARATKSQQGSTATSPAAASQQLPSAFSAPAQRSGQGQGGWQDWYNLTQKPENNPYGQAVIEEAQRMDRTGSPGDDLGDKIRQRIEKKFGAQSVEANSAIQREISIASEIFSQAWTPVGDSWFAHTEQAVGGFIFNARHVPGMFQMKNVGFQIQPLQISEADSLNGVEWAGDVAITSRVHRTYIDENHHWQDWNNGTPQYMEIGSTTYRLIKKQGQWIRPENPHPNVFRKPSPQEIDAALNGRPSLNSTKLDGTHEAGNLPKLDRAAQPDTEPKW